MRMTRMNCVGVFMRSFVVAAALLSIVTIAHAKDLSYNAKPGETVFEQLYVYTESDCTSSGQFRTKVLKEPMHGKLVIRPDTFIAEGARCNGHRFTGTKLSYTSEKSFRGIDHLSVSVGYPIDTSEMRYSYTTYDVTINVR